MTKKEFQSQIDFFLQNGDEAGARKFVSDNYLDLPADMQEHFAWAFLDEAATYAARESVALARIQQAALDSLDS
jgi:hypothetical protein